MIDNFKRCTFACKVMSNPFSFFFYIVLCRVQVSFSNLIPANIIRTPQLKAYWFACLIQFPSDFYHFCCMLAATGHSSNISNKWLQLKNDHSNSELTQFSSKTHICYNKHFTRWVVLCERQKLKPRRKFWNFIKNSSITCYKFRWTKKIQIQRLVVLRDNYEISYHVDLWS